MNRQNTSTLIRLIVWLSLMGVLTLLAIGIWTLFPDRTSITSLKWLQLFQTLALFFLPPLLMTLFCCGKPLQWLHLDKGMRWQTALFAVVLMLCAIPGINLLSYLNQQLTLPTFLEPLEALMRDQEDAANQLTEQFLQVNTTRELLINFGLMALLPAISEELTFRGTMQSFFCQFARFQRCFPKKIKVSCCAHKKIGIWTTAIVFLVCSFPILWFCTSYADGGQCSAISGVDRESVGTDTDALYQQCRCRILLLHYLQLCFRPGFYRFHRHFFYSLVGYSQYPIRADSTHLLSALHTKAG